MDFEQKNKEQKYITQNKMIMFMIQDRCHTGICFGRMWPCLR